MAKNKKPRKKINWKKVLAVTLIVLALFGVSYGLFLAASDIGYHANLKLIASLEGLTPELHPYMDEDTGYWTFETDREFKILQLTDIHIGAGGASIKKDTYAIKAVSELVHRTKPDLVIVTGDMVFPVPFMSGTFDNKREAKMFIKLMQQLNVYWAVSFGNHDTEVYSFYNRQQIAKYYESFTRAASEVGDGTKCLFTRGEANIFGEGNYIINVADKNRGEEGKKVITQSLIIMDSNAYTDNSVLWTYDNIHADQIAWYKREVLRVSSISKARGGSDIVKSLVFFHIPMQEYNDAWQEFKNNNHEDTENVKYNQEDANAYGGKVGFGWAGEKEEKSWGGKYPDLMFETALDLKSTQGFFVGHDHFNNFSVVYKGIRLTYGLSIDYLAYSGIYKKIEQRGATVIKTFTDGSFYVAPEKLNIGYKQL